MKSDSVPAARKKMQFLVQAHLSPSGVKTTRGIVNPAEKKPLAKVWAEMDWLPHPNCGGAKVGKLLAFLDSLGLKTGNPGKRALAFNAEPEKGHFPEHIRLEELDLSLPGQVSWCGTKKCFSILCEYYV